MIRSLVPGGVAEKDGRLIPGDRLVAVNGTNLENASLDLAVAALKGAPKGPVQISVAKPISVLESPGKVSDPECQQSQMETLGDQEENQQDRNRSREDHQEGRSRISKRNQRNRGPAVSGSASDFESYTCTRRPLELYKTGDLDDYDYRRLPAAPPAAPTQDTNTWVLGLTPVISVTDELAREDSYDPQQAYPCFSDRAPDRHYNVGLGAAGMAAPSVGLGAGSWAADMAGPSVRPGAAGMPLPSVGPWAAGPAMRGSVGSSRL